MMPWEAAGSDVSTPPGTSALYPHLVTVSRLRTVAGTGGTGGIGLDPVSDTGIGEDILYNNIPAAIMVRAAGRSKGPLPADVVYRPSWNITIPAVALAENDVRDQDIVADDSGYRYAVAAAQWTPLGYTLYCQRLEI
jgi:hypothetical protein